MDHAPSKAQHLVEAVIVRLVHKGVLDEDDLGAISDALSAKADDTSTDAERCQLEELAHDVNCMILEAHAPSQSDWEADQARARFRVVGGVQHEPGENSK